jgi:predicted DNA-binding transcriptional regulator AlpA
MIETRLPTWPRLLSAELAADYLSISRTSFLDGVKRHEWPAPIRLGKRTLWDRARLDRLVDVLSGLPSASPASDAAGGSSWDDS